MIPGCIRSFTSLPMRLRKGRNCANYNENFKILQIPSNSYIIFQMGKPLIPAQRRERIQEYLAVHQIVRTADLMELLETSEATVRRDLEWLEQKGFLERTHGGAILNQRVIFEQEYQQRAQHFPEEKKRIGELAASLIEDVTLFLLTVAPRPRRCFSTYVAICALRSLPTM